MYRLKNVKIVSKLIKKPCLRIFSIRVLFSNRVGLLRNYVIAAVASTRILYIAFVRSRYCHGKVHFSLQSARSTDGAACGGSNSSLLYTTPNTAAVPAILSQLVFCRAGDSGKETLAQR